MKVENLKSTKIALDINKVLSISNVSKKNIIEYLEKRDDKRFLIFKSYQEEKEDLAYEEIKELREKVDSMISKVKTGNRNLKIRSLEERFLNQKNEILSNIDKNLEEYKKNIELLNRKINDFSINEVYVGYPFVKNKAGKEIAMFTFPIIVEEENGNIYMRNNLQKEVLSNKAVFNDIESLNAEFNKISDVLNNIKSEKELIENIELLDVEIKEKSEVDILLEEKNLNDRMTKIINHKEYKNEKNLVDFISLDKCNQDVIRVLIEKDDFLLLGDKYKNREIEFIENLLINDEKVLVVGDNTSLLEEKIKNKILDFKEKNTIYNLTDKEIITKIKEVEIAIKKSKAFNEYPYSYDELNNIKSIIQKIEEVSTEKYKQNKKYFKKITFKMKNKGRRLNKDELKEIGKEIAREKNRELLIKDKTTWSIKNIFNINKQKEKRKEELELYKEKEIKEIKEVLRFYKELDENYIVLEKLDKNIFKEIINIFCKDNYSEVIAKKIKNIEFSLENKEILKDLISKKKKLFKELIAKKLEDKESFKICNTKNIDSIDLKEEIYDTVVLLECKLNEEKDILPILYRGKRCLSFRSLDYINEYENNFIKL